MGMEPLRGVGSPVEWPSSGICLLETQCGWCVVTEVREGPLQRRVRHHLVSDAKHGPTRGP